MQGSLIEKNQADKLIQEVNEIILNNNIRFIIDLSDLKYLNSSGLTILIQILTKARKAGGEAVIEPRPLDPGRLGPMSKRLDAGIPNGIRSYRFGPAIPGSSSCVNRAPTAVPRWATHASKSASVPPPGSAISSGKPGARRPRS